MTPEAMQSAWRNDGFFYMRGMVEPELVRRIEAETIAAIRADPPEKHPDEIAYLSGSDYYIYPEKRPSATAVNAEDRIAKVFNCHVFGATRAVAQRKDIVDIVAQLLGEPDIDCFQSQFIFKNPGVIGQPCTAASQCASGHCADGVCCDEACAGDCRTCATGPQPGRCSHTL